MTATHSFQQGKVKAWAAVLCWVGGRDPMHPAATGTQALQEQFVNNFYVHIYTWHVLVKFHLERILKTHKYLRPMVQHNQHAHVIMQPFIFTDPWPTNPKQLARGSQMSWHTSFGILPGWLWLPWCQAYRWVQSSPVSAPKMVATNSFSLSGTVELFITCMLCDPSNKDCLGLHLGYC